MNIKLNTTLIRRVVVRLMTVIEICFREPKCIQIWSQEVPDLSHFMPIWPTLSPNLISLVYRWKDSALRYILGTEIQYTIRVITNEYWHIFDLTTAMNYSQSSIVISLTFEISLYLHVYVIEWNGKSSYNKRSDQVVRFLVLI